MTTVTADGSATPRERAMELHVDGQVTLVRATAARHVVDVEPSYAVVA